MNVLSYNRSFKKGEYLKNLMDISYFCEVFERMFLVGKRRKVCG
jgi:hypothetical protein